MNKIEIINANSLEFREKLTDAIINKDIHVIVQMVDVKKRKLIDLVVIDGFADLLKICQVVDEKPHNDKSGIIIQDKDFFNFLQNT